MSETLWGPQRIPIIALAGETSAGKSLFSILCTETWRDHGKPADVRVFDHEGSTEPYCGSLNFSFQDVRQFLSEGVHRQILRPEATDPNWRKILLGKADVNDSPSASIFRATYLTLLKTDPGKFRVGSFDTFTPFQAGAVEWLKMHPEAFGRTDNEYKKFSAATLWPDVKSMLTYMLTVDCRLRFESFVLTLHMKNEWKNTGGGSDARKTGERIAEGLDLIDKVATLYATLDRRPKAKGKHAPEVPSGIVVFPHGKSRLVSLVDGKLRPTLPPRVPQFTPEAIRNYIANPPDYDNLKPDERLPDESLSDDQRLMVNAEISRNQAMAAEAEMSKLEMMRRAAERVTGQAVSTEAPPPAAVEPASATAKLQHRYEQGELGTAPLARSAETPASAPPVNEPPINETQSAEIKARWQEVWNTPAELCGFLQERFGVDKPKLLSESQATAVILHIVEAVAQKNDAASAGDGSSQSHTNETAGSHVASTASPSDVDDAERATAGDTPVESAENGFASREQIERIRDLAAKANWDRDKQEKWLDRRGIKTFRSAKYEDASALIDRLVKIVSSFAEQGTPGN